MRTLVAAAVLLLTVAPSPAQQREAFTADDILRVATLTVLDLSEDGRRVAASARRLVDNAVTDHRRYGDPTYVVPSMVELLVIDTRSVAIARPATGLRNIRQAAWNRAGDRLALLTAAETPAGSVSFCGAWMPGEPDGPGRPHGRATGAARAADSGPTTGVR